MASENFHNSGAHTYDIQIHSTANHSHQPAYQFHPQHISSGQHQFIVYEPHYLPAGSSKLTPNDEVNGNYTVNPELKMPGHVCHCSGTLSIHDSLSAENDSGLPDSLSAETDSGLHDSLSAENDSTGLPYVVTGGALRPTSCQNGQSVRSSWHISDDSLNTLSKKRKSSNNGSFDGSLEKIDEDPMTQHALAPHMLERSLSCSCVEKTVSQLSSLQGICDSCHVGSSAFNSVGDKRCASSSPPCVSPCSSSPSSSVKDYSPLPQINEMSSEEVPIDIYAGVQSINLNAGQEMEMDQSQNASIATSKDVMENMATDELSSEDLSPTSRPLDSKSLCLPLPFRFLKNSNPVQISKDKNISDKSSGSLSIQRIKSRPPPRQSWLLRLFESKMFDMNIAITYLYNSKEPGVQTYIGNRMFSFDDNEVDFYLPQLLNMYIHMHDVAEAIHPYLVHRCRNSIEFSVNCAWLLDAYSADTLKPNWKNSQRNQATPQVQSPTGNIKSPVPHSALLRNPLTSSSGPSSLVAHSTLATSQLHGCVQTSAALALLTTTPQLSQSAAITVVKKTHQRSKSEATG
ncbi:hypothetical protein Btru_041657 [Bulinus truncatus]|nr:hypothetical protein Btru_041657 [Bulinus truncatus]